MTRIQLLIHHFDENVVVKQRPIPIQIMFHGMSPSKANCDDFVKVTYWFPKNTSSKNSFLEVCLYLNGTINLHKVNSRAPFAGKIGAGDTLLHKYLKFSKVSRMPAIFHDGHGFMWSFNNVGFGYVYAITTEKYFRNSMLWGHISGTLFCTSMKIFNSQNVD